jgi:mannose-6-phosphate isomerase
VYDWGRTGADGKPRPLHLKKAMDVIDWQAPRSGKVAPRTLDRGEVPKELLVDSGKFVLERWTPAEDATESLLGTCLILMGIEGKVEVGPADGGEGMVLSRGRSMLLPACLEEVRLRPRGGCVLVATRPETGRAEE